jgi:hypothetical protein
MSPDLNAGTVGRWLAALLLSLPLGQGAPWLVKPVHGYRNATPAGGGRTREAQFEYRCFVTGAGHAPVSMAHEWR